MSGEQKPYKPVPVSEARGIAERFDKSIISLPEVRLALAHAIATGKAVRTSVQTTDGQEGGAS